MSSASSRPGRQAAIVAQPNEVVNDNNNRTNTGRGPRVSDLHLCGLFIAHLLFDFVFRGGNLSSTEYDGMRASEPSDTQTSVIPAATTSKINFVAVVDGKLQLDVRLDRSDQSGFRFEDSWRSGCDLHLARRAALQPVGFGTLGEAVGTGSSGGRGP